jgi:hypothetical protein
MSRISAQKAARELDAKKRQALFFHIVTSVLLLENSDVTNSHLQCKSFMKP